MTGALAALGIDEDLELSGGEEENEDPAGAAPPAAFPKHPSAPAAGVVSPPAAGRSPQTEDWRQSLAAAEDWGEAPRPLVSSAEQPPEKSSPRSSEGGDGGGEEREGGKREDIEDGELLELLEKPLQASRGRPQQPGSRPQDSNRSGRVDGNGRGAAGRKGGGSGRGNKGRGRAKYDGRAHGRNVTVKECAKWVCERLGERKYYLMCRVVATIGYRKTRALLERVQQTQVRNLVGMRLEGVGKSGIAWLRPAFVDCSSLFAHV